MAAMAARWFQNAAGTAISLFSATGRRNRKNKKERPMLTRIHRSVPNLQGWPYARPTREPRFPRRAAR